MEEKMADNKGQAPMAASQPQEPKATASTTVNVGSPETPRSRARTSVPLRATPEDRPIHIHNNIPPAPQAPVEVVNRGGLVGALVWGLGGAIVVIILLLVSGIIPMDRVHGFSSGSSATVIASPAPAPVASIPPAPTQPTNLCDDKCRAQMVKAQCGQYRKVEFEHWPWTWEEFRQTLDKVCPNNPAPVKVKAAPPPAPMPVAVVTDPCSGNEGTRLILHAWQYSMFPSNVQARIDQVHLVEAATSRDSKTKSTASVARDVGAEMRQYPAAHRMIPMQVTVTLRSTGQVVATATTSNGVAVVNIPRQYDGQELYVNWPQDAGFYNPPGGISRLIPGRDINQCINIHSIYR